MEQVSVKFSEIKLYADFQLGKFRISCDFRGQQVPLRGEWAPCSKIEKQASGFKVLLAAPDERALQLRDELRDFGRRMGEIQDFYMQIEGDLSKAAELKSFWEGLPKNIVKGHAPSLKGIFQDAPGELTAQLNLRAKGGIVELEINWQLAGVSFPTAELRAALHRRQPMLHLASGQWLSIDLEKADLLLQKAEAAGIGIDEVLPLLRQKASEQVRQLTAAGEISVAKTSLAFYEKLSREPKQKALALPENLATILRDYQKSGFEFLADRCLHGAGSILADDMGLGKTLQVLSVIYAAKKAAQKTDAKFVALVICPATVMTVWKAQAEKFIPEVKVEVWEGNKKSRAQAFRHASFDVLVTHYGMVRQEQELLVERKYDFLILDEAQAIKNPAAQVTQAIKAITAKNKLAMTGTPMENKILDLWSIMDFLNPGFFGRAEDFVSFYNDKLATLRKRASLFLLRRSKKLVAAELPARIVETLLVELAPAQRELYDITMLQIKRALKEYGPMQILAGLTKLRQICCDPELVTKKSSEEVSGKMGILLEKLTELIEAGHSVLLFSQFTSILQLIAPRLKEADIPFWTITGETALPRRGELVREFSEDQRPGVFLLSLKAAGTGLTLTKADYVFLFDPWWNPAVENQAIDRTHRLGQNKTIMAYRMVAKDTVEERVMALMEQKRDLFDAVVGEDGEQSIPTKLTRENLLELLA